jgi:hypothetical protein
LPYPPPPSVVTEPYMGRVRKHPHQQRRLRRGDRGSRAVALARRRRHHSGDGNALTVSRCRSLPAVPRRRARMWGAARDGRTRVLVALRVCDWRVDHMFESPSRASRDPRRPCRRTSHATRSRRDADAAGGSERTLSRRRVGRRAPRRTTCRAQAGAHDPTTHSPPPSLSLSSRLGYSPWSYSYTTPAVPPPRGATHMPAPPVGATGPGIRLYSGRLNARPRRPCLPFAAPSSAAPAPALQPDSPASISTVAARARP